MDKRVKKGKIPLTIFSKNIRKFIGKTCYFGNSSYDFGNLDDASKGILTDVDDKVGIVVANISGTETDYSFVLPAEWVNESDKTSRPFTIEEFLERFKLGSEIVYRHKGAPEEYHGMFTGYFIGEGVYISLGSDDFSLQELFNDFEFKDSGEFKIFGMYC